MRTNLFAVPSRLKSNHGASEIKGVCVCMSSGPSPFPLTRVQVHCVNCDSVKG